MIAPFTLSDDEVDDIVRRADLVVVSWVTRQSEPVTALLRYALLDGDIVVTSTTNRAKYHAWRRNPATSFTIWDPDDSGRVVTFRGHVEFLDDPDGDLVQRWTAAFLRQMFRAEVPQEVVDDQVPRMAAPDRHFMRLEVERTLTHDLNALLQAENEGLDVWD